jgi:hypothetical protein
MIRTRRNMRPRVRTTALKVTASVGKATPYSSSPVRWGKRGACINTISPSIIMTPLAKDELTGPRGAG